LRQISINRRSNRVLYNVTISVDSLKYEEWLLFMREEHIPKIFSSLCFESYRICKIIGEEAGGTAVAVQYVAYSTESFEKYNTVFAPRLQAEHQERFGASVAAYRTTLEIIEEGHLVDDSVE
jgi:hypothetical protein